MLEGRAAENTERIVNQQLLVSRIIHVALTAGVVGFAVFAIASPAARFEATFPRMDWIFAGFGLATAIGGWVIPSLIMAGSSRASLATSSNRDVAAQASLLALASYQSAMIVGWAMFEGGAIGNLVWYYSDKQPLNLAVAGVLLVFLLFRFPRRDVMLEKVESRLRELREAKQMKAARQ
jgi:hypothetical protein